MIRQNYRINIDNDNIFVYNNRGNLIMNGKFDFIEASDSNTEESHWLDDLLSEDTPVKFLIKIPGHYFKNRIRVNQAVSLREYIFNYFKKNFEDLKKTYNLPENSIFSYSGSELILDDVKFIY